MSFLTRWIRLRVAWLTLCAVAFGVVAPSVSHALAMMTGRVWIEVCSAEGTRQLAVEIGSDKIPNQLQASADCPFCLLQGDGPSPIGSVGRAAFQPLAGNAVLPLDSSDSRSFQFVWAAHYSRAPPDFS